MLTLTPDVLALVAAIDGGDHTALPTLADALEEAGDPRADGLRVVDIDAVVDDGGVAWIDAHRHPEARWRLRQQLGGGSAQWAFPLPARSSAFLALAQALTEE